MGLVERREPDVPAPREVAGDGDFVDTAPNVSALAPSRPRDFSHLVPCRHCGTLNSWSARQCWGCEADRWKDLSSQPALGPAVGAPEAVEDEPLAVGHSQQISEVGSATPRLATVVPARAVSRRPRRSLQIAAAIAVVAIAGVASVVRWGMPSREAATDNAVRGSNAVPAEIAADRVAVEPPITRAATGAVEVNVGDDLPVPQTGVALPDGPTQAGPAQPEPCTEQLAALGLCAAPTNRSKEFGWTGN